jgi:hypothetical protein
MTQAMLISLLDTIQLKAGIGKPILESCTALAYIEWSWIPQIRNFLWHINGQIIGATTMPQTYHEHDTYLMDSLIVNSLSQRDQIYIHQCRLYLQIETLSDIATSNRKHIHQAWHNSETEKPSTSDTQWPCQKSPHDTSWKVWSKFLDSFCIAGGSLQQPLGRWLMRNTSRTHRAYYHHDTQNRWSCNNTEWQSHNLISQQCKY